jgi:hypothetical protein
MRQTACLAILTVPPTVVRIAGAAALNRPPVELVAAVVTMIAMAPETLTTVTVARASPTNPPEVELVRDPHWRWQTTRNIGGRRKDWAATLLNTGLRSTVTDTAAGTVTDTAAGIGTGPQSGRADATMTTTTTTTTAEGEDVGAMIVATAEVRTHRGTKHAGHMLVEPRMSCINVFPGCTLEHYLKTIS